MFNIQKVQLKGIALLASFHLLKIIKWEKCFDFDLCAGMSPVWPVPINDLDLTTLTWQFYLKAACS